MNLNSLLTPPEAAKVLRTTPATLANWRCKEIGPQFTRMPNGRIYYTEEALQTYLEGDSNRGIIKNKRLVPLSVIMSVRAGNGINMV